MQKSSERIFIRATKRRLRILTFLPWLLMVSVLVPLIASGGTALAQSVSLSSSSGSPGATITASGAGFNTGDTYQIIFAPGTSYEQVLAPTTSISGTSFSRSVTIPAAAWGQYNIQVGTNRGTFSPVFSITPRIELSTTVGNTAEIVAVNGVGFRANAAVNIRFNNTNLITTQTNSYGNFAGIDFPVPELPRGNYGIYGTDGIASSPDVSFSIRAKLTTDQQEGSVGDEITLRGTGFAGNSEITLFWDNSRVSGDNIFTNSRGTFTTTFTIPRSPRGNHSLKAQDVSFGSDTVIFQVRQNIVISPASGIPGDTITVTGRGFRSNIPVSITYSGTAVSTSPSSVRTDAEGSFTASFMVPSTVSGNYAVRASDGIYAATATFLVISSIDLSPNSGAAGMELVVKGNGFTPGGRVSISYDDIRMITVTADSTGAFSVSFSVPASRAGNHTVTASDLTVQGVQATATFTMESIPPPAPVLLRPEYETLTDTHPQFDWTDVNDPSGVTYDLQIARDTGFMRLVLARQGLNQSGYQLGQSEALQLTKKDNPYYWRVKAVDGAGNEGAWTSPGSFYTQDSTAPARPIVLSPVNGSQAATRPRFDWADVSDPSGVTYELEVATDANFLRLVLSRQGLNQSEYLVRDNEELDLTKKDAPYYWRVRAVDGAENASDWTVSNTFYTQDSTAPPAPVLLTPEHGAQEPGDVLFDWTDVTDESGVTYTLEVAQDAEFSRIVIYKENLSQSEYKLTDMEELRPTTGDPPSPYYWRVRAIDGAENPSIWATPNAFYVGGFLQLRGWVLYILMAIIAALLLAVGILIGKRMGASSPSNGG